MIAYPFSDAGVAAALQALGATENEVAANLYAFGFRGVQGSESQSPEARYLVDSIPGAAHVEVCIEVGGDSEAWAIVSGPDHEDAAADLPPPVRTFSLRFDDGKYPDLIKGAAA